MARSKAIGNRTRGKRSDQQPDNGIQDVYKEMLREALSSSPAPETVGERPVKRRKTARAGAGVSESENAIGPVTLTSDAENNAKSEIHAGAAFRC